MQRRALIRNLTLGAAGVALAAPAVHAQKRYRWRMATSWTPALDVLQGNAVRYAKVVDEMSEGRLKIQVFAAGELIAQERYLVGQIPAGESDLRPRSAVIALAAASTTVVAPQAAQPVEQEWWRWLALAVLGLLAVEWWWYHRA